MKSSQSEPENQSVLGNKASISIRPRHDRRSFLKRSALAVAGMALTRAGDGRAEEPPVAANPLPRWRGFNLTDFFQAFSSGEQGRGEVHEEDLQWIRDWGFDFIRLPMDYWLWIDTDWKRTRRLQPDDVYKIKESMLERVDRTVHLCRHYGLHLNLNFHRAPGYCINNPGREPFVLWSDRRAQDAFVYHWELFAKRYRGIPRQALSFNLVNEAPSPREGYMTREQYAAIMTRAANSIRRVSPHRIVIADGLRVGTEVCRDLIPTGVAQSVHAYWPARLTHFHAPWVDKKMSFPVPTWPLKDQRGRVIADRKKLEARFAPWGKLARSGIGVHCGECGCYNQTPYPVFTAWFTDVMEVLKQHQIGYALWNFRGSFGVLDSGRRDAAYEEWHGHRLDRRLLTLLQRF